MIDREMFIYNDTPDFPEILPLDKIFCLHKKSDTLNLLGYIFFFEDFYVTNMKYIGVYIETNRNFKLIDVVPIDQDNVIEAMKKLTPYMNM